MKAEATKKPRLLTYCIVLSALLLLPVFNATLGLPSRQTLYEGLPAIRGQGGRVASEIFDNNNESDVAFVGSSTMFAAFRPTEVDRYFESQLGHKPAISYLYILRSKPDIHYLLLKDYLERHKTKLVVLELPERFITRNEPDMSVSDMLRYGEVPEFYEGMSLKHRMAVYGEFVLDGPRQLLNAIRPNYLSPLERSAEGLNQDVLTRYGPLQESRTPYESDPDRYILYPGSPKARFEPTKSDDSYFSLFIGKILALAKAHHTKVVLVNLPMARDVDHEVNAVNLVKSTLAADQVIVGGTSTELFGNLSSAAIEQTYFGDPAHLNAKGTDLFLSKILPAIERVYKPLDAGGKP